MLKFLPTFNDFYKKYFESNNSIWIFSLEGLWCYQVVWSPLPCHMEGKHEPNICKKVKTSWNSGEQKKQLMEKQKDLRFCSLPSLAPRRAPVSDLSDRFLLQLPLFLPSCVFFWHFITARVLLPIFLLLFISRLAERAVCGHGCLSLSALSLVPPSPSGRSTLAGMWGGGSASKFRKGAPSASTLHVGGTLWPLNHQTAVALDSPSSWLPSVGSPGDQLSRVASSAFLQRYTSVPPELAVGVYRVSWTPSLLPTHSHFCPIPSFWQKNQQPSLWETL